MIWCGNLTYFSFGESEAKSQPESSKWGLTTYPSYNVEFARINDAAVAQFVTVE